MTIKKFSRRKDSSASPIADTNRSTEACEHCRSWQKKYQALEQQYRCAQEECQALRDELAHRVMKEGRTTWQTNWKY